MVWNDIRKSFEPKPRQRSQHFALVLDWRWQNAVKRGDTIGGDNQEMIIIHSINITHFAATY
jgi:hypothetical protein